MKRLASGGLLILVVFMSREALAAVVFPVFSDI